MKVFGITYFQDTVKDTQMENCCSKSIKMCPYPYLLTAPHQPFYICKSNLGMTLVVRTIFLSDVSLYSNYHSDIVNLDDMLNWKCTHKVIY